jgi:hypothetical protein
MTARQRFATCQQHGTDVLVVARIVHFAAIWLVGRGGLKPTLKLRPIGLSLLI